jgi:hypothetical protein
MSRSRIEVHLRSSRAPYRRGGVAFGSSRSTLVIPREELTDEAMERLEADPTISVQIVEVAAGGDQSKGGAGGTALVDATSNGSQPSPGADAPPAGEGASPNTGAPSNDKPRAAKPKATAAKAPKSAKPRAAKSGPAQP